MGKLTTEADRMICVGYKADARIIQKQDDAWSYIWLKERARRYEKKKYLKAKGTPKQKASKARKAKRWRVKYKEQRAAYDKAWRLANPGKWDAIRNRDRARPEAKLATNLRKRVREIIKTSSETLSDLCGCSGKALRLHIERQWVKGMTWENYGAWHVDHHAPCAAFNLRDSGQRRSCFHFTNLRPMWAEDNLKKGARILAPVQVSLAIAA